MLNIVLICGGTGGIAVQKGFAELYGYDNYRLDVVINAYDNGKSTGACRKVFDGKILGPSDLRKNQITQYKLLYKEQLKDEHTYEAKLLSLFELRLTAEIYEEYFERARSLLEDCLYLKARTKELFLLWVKYFFFENYEERRYRKAVATVDFNDFCLSNIFYASCAAMNGNSLGCAGRIMAEILKIEDRVHLISDVPLFLKAQTENGHIIENEESIIGWNNASDKIAAVLLEDEAGNTYTPAIDERNEVSIKEIFEKADILIFSSGTQWSSLIPTYIHAGFKKLINNIKAKKYLIMNNIEDGDMVGVCANELLEIVGQYIDLDSVKIVVNDNAADSMRSVSGKYSVLNGSLSEPKDRKHIPEAITAIIMRDYYKLEDKKPQLISDLDGTLWDEKAIGHAMETGVQNLSLFEGVMISGNSYDHVYYVANTFFKNHENERIYCDYGNTYFRLGDPKGVTGKLSEEFIIDGNIVEKLERDSDFKGKVNLRGDVIITIKPLDDRENKIKKARAILDKYGKIYEAHIAGRTSIDIVKKGFCKATSLKLIIQKEKINEKNIIYIGNELIEGNEACIRDMGVQTLQMNDVFETNVFLKTYFKVFDTE